jgi:hypothetical protein
MARKREHVDGHGKRPQGRPRGGRRPGDRVRDYPTLTVRVPPETRAMLKELSKQRSLPLWQMLRHLIVCFVRDLPLAQRRSILRVSRTTLQT